jgi:hypothetical protein
MKRSHMIDIIAECLVEPHYPDDALKEAACILKKIEKYGMTPPRLSEEDCQAIMNVYYAGYSLHQWDEDIELDEKVQEAKKRRAKARKRYET